MSFGCGINAYFVTTSDKTDDVFKEAYCCLLENISEEHVREIKANEGFPLIASGGLTKTDVFVFDKFEGDFFVELQKTKSLIVGPRCILRCVVNCIQIPLGTSPIYTVAMRNLQICATGITVQEKEKLRTLVLWMGGYFFLNFGRSITHLISNTIKSNKYEHATMNGIPVMHVDWVQRVWERSYAENAVDAIDPEFDKYRLPIFFGTNITSTGLDVETKDKILNLVNANGGTYHCAFRSNIVDIVITEKHMTSSKKYKAAILYKKDVLTPDWIFDSVEKGFALPTKPYQIKSLKVSTPTKDDQSIADFTAISDLSRISLADSKRSGTKTINETVDETQQSVFAMPAPVSATTSKDLARELLKKNAESHYRLVYDEICPNRAKKAGNFLDGCRIYLSGFRNEEKEKLNRILNVGGATRYDVVNEKITHIIVGQLDDTEFRSWKNDGYLTVVHVVRLNWLLESINLKQPASEVVYRVSLPTTREPDVPSPSSKRTLRSMNHSFKQPSKPIKKKLFSENAENINDPNESEVITPIASSTELPLEEDEQHLISQYSQENVPIAPVPLPIQTTPSSGEQAKNKKSQPSATSTQDTKTSTAPTPVNTTEGSLAVMSTIDYDNLNFFQGLTIYIVKEHFAPEFYEQLINECESAQGVVVTDTFEDVVDYVIVSFEHTFDESNLRVKAANIINELYMEACMKENKLVPLEYYHKFIPHIAEAHILENMVIVVSVYADLEREFITTLATLMGARVNKNFAKKERPLLICPHAEGSKYEGALKWRFPVVTSAWLVDCACNGRKLPYNQYLVGDSPENFPGTPPMQEQTSMMQSKVTPMRIDNEEVENNVAKNSSFSKNDAVDFTPLRNKRVSELAGPSRKSLNALLNTSPHTPNTPVNDFALATYSLDFLDRLVESTEDAEARECLRGVVNDIRNNQTPELERIRRQACTPINRKVPTPKGIPDFCTTPEFKKRMAEEFHRHWHLPTKKIKCDTPIEILRKRVINMTCRVLGLDCSDDEELEEPTTSAKSHNSSRSDKQQSSVSKSCTLSRTLTAASTATPVQHITPAQKNAPRALFLQSPGLSVNTSSSDIIVPSTQTPPSAKRGTPQNKSNISGMGQRGSLTEKSTINFDKISFEETGNESPTTSRLSSISKNSSASTSPDVNKITEYLKNCESRRQSMQRSVSREKTDLPIGITDSEMINVQPFESEQFCMGTEEMVGWRDPVEFSVERRVKSISKMQYKGKPKFSISCLDEERREDIINKILQLDGEVSENLVNFDPLCTHFICEKPNRAEKILGCLASGKWVLSLNYIEESYAKDGFVDEELYEWGNYKALNMPELTADEQVIAQAAHNWRKKLSSSTDHDGAFSGYRCILRLNQRSLDAIKNVIKAGNGVIIEAAPPFNDNSQVKFATHCFADMKKTPLTSAEFKYLQDNNVKIYSQMYINFYLLSVGDFDATKYEIKLT